MGKSWRIICAAGAGRGEGVICTFPRMMRTLLQDVGFSGAVGAGRGEDALGSHVLEFENSFMAAAEVDSLEALRMRRSPTRAITIPESGWRRGRVNHGETYIAELRRSLQRELILLSARLHEASFSCHFHTFLCSTESRHDPASGNRRDQ